MNRCVLRTVLCLILMMGCGILFAQRPPQLDLIEKTIVRDTVSMSDGVQTFVFHYQNVGDSALVISRVVPGCTCVVPEYSTQPLAPGDTASFRVRFTPPHAGRYNQMLTICSNGVKPILRAYIKGFVVDKQQAESD